MNTSDMARILGKRGGDETYRLHGKAHLTRISKLGNMAKKAKRALKDTHPLLIANPSGRE